MRRWLVGMNSMRAVAIILIVIYHLFRGVLPGGFVAVDIFFALSGFLITNKLLREYKEDKIHYWRFLGKQFMRLFPTLLICVIITLSIGYFVTADMMTGARENTFYALTFSENIAEILGDGSYEANLIPNVLSHTWFLGLIMQFYLLFPLLMKLFLPIFKKYKTAVKSFGVLCFVLAAVSGLLMYAYGVVFDMPDRAYFGLDTHMAALMLGAALASVYALKPKLFRMPKLVSGLLVLGALGGIVAMSILLSFDNSLTFVFGLSLTAVLAVVMIAGLVQLQPIFKKPNWLIKIPEYIGSISFGIYLFHWPLYLLLPFILPSDWPGWISPTLTIVLSVGLAALTHAFVDTGKIFAFFRKPKFWKFAIAAVVLAGVLWLPVQTLIHAPDKSSIQEQLDSEAAKGVNTELLSPSDETIDYSGAVAFVESTKGIISPHFAAAAALAPRPKPVVRPTGGGAAIPAGVNISGASVLVIGDSVTLGAKSALEASIAGVVVDAKVSRFIYSAAGILASYKASGPLPEIIVIGLATNAYNITNGLLQGILDVAGDGHSFVFITAYAGPNQPREGQNATLKNFANSHGNVYIADWWAVAQGNWSLLTADRIHLQRSGQQAFANVVTQAIAGIPR